MEQTWIYICEDNIEGIFTAVYDAWADKHGHNNTKIEVRGLSACNTFQLFCNYIEVAPDFEKSEKVAKSIKAKISMDAYNKVVKATLSSCEDKADSIYHFLVRGFAIGSKVINFITDPYVARIVEMNCSVEGEAHLYLGFLRFEEMINGIMLAKFEPNNDIAQLVAPHFVDRFPDGNFIILDSRRRRAAVYSAGKPWVILDLTPEQMEQLQKMSEQEEQVKSLWKTFFKQIAIEEIVNKRTKRNHIPIHYRKYMLEFDTER